MRPRYVKSERISFKSQEVARGKKPMKLEYFMKYFSKLAFFLY
jgi:hypothetical protein